MLQLSKATETRSFFGNVINEVRGIKIKRIFSICPSWHMYKGHRLYSDCTPLYILFENGQCLILEYYFIDKLRAEFRQMTVEEIAEFQDLSLIDYFNSSDEIYNCVEGEIADIDCTETIALEYGNLESVELRQVTWEYSQWINGNIESVLPTDEKFDEIKFIMSNGNTFVICGDDAYADGYVLAWSTDSEETTLI